MEDVMFANLQVKPQPYNFNEDVLFANLQVNHNFPPNFLFCPCEKTSKCVFLVQILFLTANKVWKMNSKVFTQGKKRKFGKGGGREFFSIL
jgi:hypothetical protein